MHAIVLATLMTGAASITARSQIHSPDTVDYDRLRQQVVNSKGFKERVTAACHDSKIANCSVKMADVMFCNLLKRSRPALAVDHCGADPAYQFLANVSKEEGVVRLSSGLMYKVMRRGNGTHHPKLDSPCECNYRGALIDGTEFDSSYKRGEPSTFAPDQVIKGWKEALQLMVEGDKWELYVPPNLGYGEQGAGDDIPPHSSLVFEIELLKIKR